MSGQPGQSGRQSSEPGTESVWDYPRPPALVPDTRRVTVRFAGTVVADSRSALRVLETSHPPVFYVPPADVRTDLLRPAGRRTWCEWKGQASYFDLVVDGQEALQAAWTYPRPEPAFRDLKDHLAFYPGRVEECTVDGHPVERQEGDFYGGWITPEIRGPFKGAPGTMGW